MDQTILNLAKAHNRMRNNRGFTLVELMSVLAILAIIAAIAVPRFTGTIETAKQKADQITLDVLQQAVNQYMIDHNGTVPNTFQLEDDYIDGDWPAPQRGGTYEINDSTGEVTDSNDSQQPEK